MSEQTSTPAQIAWDLQYSIDFMTGWIEDAPGEVVRNWKRVAAAVCNTTPTAREPVKVTEAQVLKACAAYDVAQYEAGETGEPASYPSMHAALTAALATVQPAEPSLRNARMQAISEAVKKFAAEGYKREHSDWIEARARELMRNANEE